MHTRLFRLLTLATLSLTGCGDTLETCTADPIDDCAMTTEVDVVCGCDGVTYVNPAEAACHNVYTYTKGQC